MPAQNNFIHKTAEVSSEAKIGSNVKVWQNSQVLPNAIVGDDCVIGHNSAIFGKAKLGKGVKIQSNTDVWDLVELGDYVFVGPSAVFTNDKNPRAKYPKSEYPSYGAWLPTKVCEGATIGANATILCGITIGKWAMIGAGALVSCDVPDYGIFVGNPARIAGWICECGAKLEFNNKEAECRICRAKFILKDGKAARL